MKLIKFTNFAQLGRYLRSSRFGRALKEEIAKNYKQELSKATKRGIARSKKLKNEKQAGRLLAQRR